MLKEFLRHTAHRPRVLGRLSKRLEREQITTQRRHNYTHRQETSSSSLIKRFTVSTRFHSFVSFYPFHCNDVIWKQQIKVRKLKSLSFSALCLSVCLCLCLSSFSCFALAHERIFMKTYTTESRFALGEENLLFAGVCVHFSSRTFFRLGQWRG